MFSAIKFLTLFLVTAIGAVTYTTDFVACPGVDNVLGISSILYNYFNNGAILGVIQHTPTVDLSGSAFVTWSYGNFTKYYVEDFSKINPNGLPLPAGVTNTVVSYAEPSWKTFKLFKEYKAGDLIPIKFSGYAWVNESVAVPLGCITFNLVKPAFPWFNKSTETSTTGGTTPTKRSAAYMKMQSMSTDHMAEEESEDGSSTSIFSTQFMRGDM